MGWLKRVLSPEAILLLYECISEKDSDRVEEEVREVKKYYDLVKAEAIVARLEAHQSPRGLAALMFRNARRGVFSGPVPFLRENGIPFTVFLRSDCVGLTRLPWDEEIQLYVAEDPHRADEAKALVGEMSKEPRNRELGLARWRGRHGPLPVERIPPNQFMATWGRLRQLSPESVQWGAHLTTPMIEGDLIDEQLKYLRRQIGAEVSLAFSPSPWLGSTDGMRGVGLRAVVTERTEVLGANVNLRDLPVWRLEAE